MTTGEVPRRRRRSRPAKSKWRVSRAGLAVMIGALVIGLLLILSTFLSRREAAAPRTGGAPVAVSIQFSAPLGARFAGEIVAANAGFFRQANIETMLMAGQDDAATIASVVSGRALVGVVDPVSFLIARSKGQPIVAFAADYVENTSVFYTLARPNVSYSLEKSYIAAPEDFAGRKVGRIAGTREALFYDAMLNLRGISRSDIRETAENVNVDGLVAGTIDVLPGRLGVEDDALRSKGASFRTMRLFDFGIHVPDYVYVATERTINDRPSLLVRLLEATIAGWTRTYADVPAAGQMVADRSGGTLSAGEATLQVAAQRDFVVTVGRRIMEFDQVQWKQLARILINARQLDEYFDLSRAVNYSILKDAYRKPLSFGSDLGPEPAPLLGR